MAQTGPGRGTAEAGGSGLPDSVSSAIRKTRRAPQSGPKTADSQFLSWTAPANTPPRRPDMQQRLAAAGRGQVMASAAGRPPAALTDILISVPSTPTGSKPSIPIGTASPSPAPLRSDSVAPSAPSTSNAPAPVREDPGDWDGRRCRRTAPGPYPSLRGPRPSHRRNAGRDRTASRTLAGTAVR